MTFRSMNSGSMRHVAISFVILGLAFLGYSTVRSSLAPPLPELGPDETEAVHRVSLDVSVNAPGVIESASNTKVECEIERLELRVQGRTLSSSGSTRILTLVPDGSIVKKGDVICTLDASQFDEMLRTQRINVERAKSEELQASMELDVAKIALDEYSNGSAKQQIQTIKGQIALAQTDATRLTSRLEWARKMYEKGYLSRTAMRSEELAMQRSDIQFSNAELSLKILEKYTQPKTEHQLRTRILSLERVLASEKERTERFIERLRTYEKMVEKCTIRAPHDGMLVYAHDPDRNFRVEEGADVRQGQTLFYLPDLNRMQVMARLSESVVQKVNPGMKARIEVESVTGHSYTGTVERIAQFPIPPSSWRSSNDIKNYYCIIRIDDVDTAIRPGLNAEVKILTDTVNDSIALSPDSVIVEGKQEFCFVLRPDGTFEKRQIRTRTGDPTSLAVLEGLKEGDVVLRNPKKVEDTPEFVTSVTMLDGSLSDVRETVAQESPEPEVPIFAEMTGPVQGDTNLALPASTTGY